MDAATRYLLMADDDRETAPLAAALGLESAGPDGPDAVSAGGGADRAEVVRAANLFDAAAVLRDGGVGALFFDTGFGGCRPGDALSLLAGTAPETPLIMLADHDHLPAAWAAVRQGAQDYFLKPHYDEGMLRHRVRTCQERLRQARDTERRLAEANKDAARYEKLIQDNSDAMLVLDGSGRIKFANRAAASLLKCSAAGLVGSNPGIPVDNCESMEIVISRQRSPDTVVDMRVTRTVWDDEAAYLATLRDISLRKRTERALLLAKQQAELASETKSKFLANMSHELRTPLNSILGFAEMMQEGVFGKVNNPRYEDYLATIRHSGRHLLTLINNLLDLSKIEAGREELDEQIVDIEDLLQAAVQAEEPNAREHGLTLVCDVETPAPLLQADPVKLDQIVLNLLSNAIKFTPEGGRVTLSGRGTESGGYEIAVMDSGCGMTAEDIQQAMGLFMQVRSPYVRGRDRGTGLGLPIARSLAKLHDGELEITSQRGFGTKAIVTLPARRVVNETVTAFKAQPSAARPHY